MCPEYNKVTNFGRDHQNFSYGYTIEAIVFRDGKWWAVNCRCATPIQFCPFCGVNLYTLKETEHIPIKPSYPKKVETISRIGAM